MTYWLSFSKNITYIDLLNYPNMAWNWHLLSQNPSILTVRSTDMDYVEAVYKHLAAKRIQRKWRHVISNPEYAVCRRRLMREFHVLTG
jgi:hypothetical protein